MLYFGYTSSETGKSFLDFFDFCQATLLKFTLITFLRSLIKMRKIYIRATCILHFENGPNANSD